MQDRVLNMWTFRGFDIIGHKWVYGDLVHNKKVTQTGLEDRVMVGGYEVAPESVGILVGRTDDMGENLYEGDVCSISCYGRTLYAEIVYLGSKGAFYYKAKSLVVPMDFASSSIKKGNVYQNVDLLDR